MSIETLICGAMLAKGFARWVQPQDANTHIKRCPYCFDSWLYHEDNTYGGGYAKHESYHVTCKCRRMDEVQRHSFNTKEAAIRFWNESVDAELNKMFLEEQE